MVIVHPQPLDDCPCFEDAIAFLSVIMGLVTARWVCVRHGLLPKDDNPLSGGLYSQSEAIVEPALELFRNSLPGGSKRDTANFLPILWTLLKKTSMVLFGISIIIVVRIVVKTICRIVLPPIFRYAQGTLGFILPRRHYQQTTPTPNSPKKPTRPPHKRQSSSAGGNFFSNVSDPKEYDSIHWKIDSRSTIQQNQDQLQSDGQLRPVKAERSKVKFTLGDGTDVPVPFTHPNTHLPGDGFSERLASAFSGDEKQRQQREMESNFRFPTRQEADSRITNVESDVVGHYDVDVLTKVFVYHAVGFFAGGPLPAFFAKTGW